MRPRKVQHDLDTAAAVDALCVSGVRVEEPLGHAHHRLDLFDEGGQVKAGARFDLHGFNDILNS